jgi:hypothetical protein
LVQVQLLLPAVDVYLPAVGVYLPAQAAAPAATTGCSRLGSGSISSSAAGWGSSSSSSGQYRRSSSKLARSSSNTSKQQPAEQPEQQQSSSVADASAAELVQNALAKTIGVDPKVLTYFAVQPAQLQELLQPQQQQQQGVCQVVAGLQPGCCSFSLGALEAVLTAAAQQAGEAEAARTELQQLQVCVWLLLLTQNKFCCNTWIDGEAVAARVELQQLQVFGWLLHRVLLLRYMISAVQ